jgi:galactokinase
MKLLDKVKDGFVNHFRMPASNVFRAPGRVNLLGEHTDYNGGFVLPCAINFETIIVARKRDDTLVNVFALDYQQTDQFDLKQPIKHHKDYLWANYVRGVANSLQDKGFSLVGCDLAIGGNIPQGAGLSSSAALEVVLGLAYTSLAHEKLSSKENALNGQHAENNFVGCNCGIMDQLISAQGEKDKALLIDCRSLKSEKVAMPKELSVVIINSNVKRGLVDSEYNKRREQCEQVAKFYGVSALRDISWQQFYHSKNELIAATSVEITNRAKHVISENERTVQASLAIAANDIKALSQLMAESHKSMQYDFEITVPEIDYLVELIHNTIGDKGGVRMTGGGFGGCVVALVPNDVVEQIKAIIADNYQKKTGLIADVFVCEVSQGAEEISA